MTLQPAAGTSREVVVAAEEVSVRFGSVVALDTFDLAVAEGPYGVGLVGESGSGKTTAARALLGLVKPARGRVTFRGSDLATLRHSALREYRRQVQVVFQDPEGTLDPRMRVGLQVEEVLRTHRLVEPNALRARVEELFETVGLEAAHTRRLPSQLSGGQRQRVSIARALALRPRVLILDEPTSALDVTTQSRILNLVERLRTEHGLAYVLISHNLAVVERLCEDVVVLFNGQIVERGPTRRVLAAPEHPYTAELIAAVPHLPTTIPPANEGDSKTDPLSRRGNSAS